MFDTVNKINCTLLYLKSTCTSRRTPENITLPLTSLSCPVPSTVLNLRFISIISALFLVKIEATVHIPSTSFSVHIDKMIIIQIFIGTVCDTVSKWSVRRWTLVLLKTRHFSVKRLPWDLFVVVMSSRNFMFLQLWIMANLLLNMISKHNQMQEMIFV